MKVIVPKPSVRVTTRVRPLGRHPFLSTRMWAFRSLRAIRGGAAELKGTVDGIGVVEAVAVGVGG